MRKKTANTNCDIFPFYLSEKYKIKNVFTYCIGININNNKD